MKLILLLEDPGQVAPFLVARLAHLLQSGVGSLDLLLYGLELRLLLRLSLACSAVAVLRLTNGLSIEPKQRERGRVKGGGGGLTR